MTANPIVLTSVRSNLSLGSAVALRIDGVVEMHAGLCELLNTHELRQICCSLEMIPFSPLLCEAALTSRIEDHSRIAVGQHGCGTLYANSTNLPHNRQREATLCCARDYLRNKFPSKTVSGFSAPGDCWDAHFASEWAECGGQFLSFAKNRPSGAALRTVHLSAAAWTEATYEVVPSEAIMLQIRRSTSKIGYGGIVLHERQLRQESDIQSIRKILVDVCEAGFQFVSLDSLASFQARAMPLSTCRDYFGGVISLE